MRILVISDIHGDFFSTESIIDRHQSAKEVIFLGDGIREMREIEDLYPEKNFYLLKGNCDFGDGETEGFIELAGKKIFFTHGHTYSVKNDYDYSTLRDKGRSMGADIVLFGHTHKPFSDYRNNIYFLNPGSARDGRYGIIDIVNGEILTSTGRLK